MRCAIAPYARCYKVVAGFGPEWRNALRLLRRTRYLAMIVEVADEVWR